MDRTERYIAAEILDRAAVQCSHQMSVLHSVAHKQRDGLTDKEYRFLMARYDATKSEMEKLGKLATRLRKS